MATMLFAVIICIGFTLAECGTTFNTFNTTVKLNGTGLQLVSFGWSASCTDSKNPLATVQEISLLPDPLQIPGKVSLHFEGQLNRMIQPPMPLHLRIYKKIAFAWLKIPCQSPDKLGSCDYDFCTKWPLPRDPQGGCPEAYKKSGIPCECPFEEKHYNLQQSKIADISGTGVPEWLERGDYKIKAWISEPDNEYALCFELNLTIKPV